MPRILIRGARQLLTLRGANGPRRGTALGRLGLIEDGAVYIEDDIIREVGPTRRLENLASTLGASTIDAHGCVVMPGFVDCHAHLVSGNRSNLPHLWNDSSLIASCVGSVQSTPQTQLRSEAIETLQRASSLGTTTMGAIGGFGLDESSEFKILRTYHSLSSSPVRIVPSYYGLNTVPPGVDREKYVNHVINVSFPNVERRRLAEFAHVACGDGHFDVGSCRQFMDSSSGTIHLRVCFAPDGPAEPIASLLHPNVSSFEHLEFAALSDLQVLAQSDALAVLLPATAFFRNIGRFGHGRTLADSGAAIALGSDFNQATAPGCSMQFAIWLACRRMKLSVDEALTAATLNAAHVLSLGDSLGSIEPGKQADILILQTPDYRVVGHEFGGNLIGMTIKDGEIVYQAADFQ